MINANKFFKFIVLVGILIYLVIYLQLQIAFREPIDLNEHIDVIKCDLLNEQNKHYDHKCIRYNNSIYLPFQFLSSKFDVISLFSFIY
jgi:hypothetical protein